MQAVVWLHDVHDAAIPHTRALARSKLHNNHRDVHDEPTKRRKRITEKLGETRINSLFGDSCHSLKIDVN